MRSSRCERQANALLVFTDCVAAAEDAARPSPAVRLAATIPRTAAAPSNSAIPAA
jgi:hypothetical protein